MEIFTFIEYEACFYVIQYMYSVTKFIIETLMPVKIFSWYGLSGIYI